MEIKVDQYTYNAIGISPEIFIDMERWVGGHNEVIEGDIFEYFNLVCVKGNKNVKTGQTVVFDNKTYQPKDAKELEILRHNIELALALENLDVFYNE